MDKIFKWILIGFLGLFLVLFFVFLLVLPHRPRHGIVGQVIRIDNSGIIIRGRDNIERTIRVGDRIVVIGVFPR